MTEWFEQWFGEDYLKLYPHRNDEDAEHIVTLLDGIVPLDGIRVLDLACGPGRHAVRMAARGARVVGLDLSMVLLDRAKHGDPPADILVRGDMRYLPFGDATFDLVVNLFTSFGYFADDSQHQLAMSAMSSMIKSGGKVIMDFLNADSVRSGLVAHEEVQVGEQDVIIERKLVDDDKYVVKVMHVVEDGKRFMERVRLFSVDDLVTMMGEAGLDVIERFGNYDGDPLGAEATRTILVATRG